jgi:hypothetical protein
MAPLATLCVHPLVLGQSRHSYRLGATVVSMRVRAAAAGLFALHSIHDLTHSFINCGIAHISRALKTGRQQVVGAHSDDLTTSLELGSCIAQPETERGERPVDL